MLPVCLFFTFFNFWTKNTFLWADMAKYMEQRVSDLNCTCPNWANVFTQSKVEKHEKNQQVVNDFSP